MLPSRKWIDPASRIKARGNQGKLGSLGEAQEIHMDWGLRRQGVRKQVSRWQQKIKCINSSKKASGGFYL